MDGIETTERKTVVSYTIEEFAGCFGYTLEKALYEIKKYNLFDPVPHINTQKIYESRRVGDVGSVRKEPDRPMIRYVSEDTLEKYKAMIALEKTALETQSTCGHPCLNPEHPLYSEELALALKAWEYATSKISSKANFMIRVDGYLNKHIVGEKQRERIKSVCNPFKRGPRPAYKK